MLAYNAVPFDIYQGLGFDGAADLGNMFQFKHDFEDYFCGARSIDFSKSSESFTFRSFDSWLEENKSKIPLGIITLFNTAIML